MRLLRAGGAKPIMHPIEHEYAANSTAEGYVVKLPPAWLALWGVKSWAKSCLCRRSGSHNWTGRHSA
jgi:hypothetical protein